MAKDLGYSTSFLQRHRYDLKMQTCYKSKNAKGAQKLSNGFKRPQKTSKESVNIGSTNQGLSIKPITNRKNKLKSESMHEIKDECLKKFLHTNSSLWRLRYRDAASFVISMELPMQIISYDRIVRSNTVQSSKDFSSQTLATQAKKGKQVVPTMPCEN